MITSSKSTTTLRIYEICVVMSERNPFTIPEHKMDYSWDYRKTYSTG